MAQDYLLDILSCFWPVTITCTSKPVMESSISQFSSVLFRHFTNILLLANTFFFLAMLIFWMGSLNILHFNVPPFCSISYTGNILYFIYRQYIVFHIQAIYCISYTGNILYFIYRQYIVFHIQVIYCISYTGNIFLQKYSQNRNLLKEQESIMRLYLLHKYPLK
jgi:hypothetical protein